MSPGADNPAPVLPLAGVRVVDMSDGRVEVCGRFLAELGADVVKVEPPQGARSRFAHPQRDGISLSFATDNVNKRGVCVDLGSTSGREQLDRLLGVSDIWIETSVPGVLASLGMGPLEVLARHPTLVIVSATPFGQTEPYRTWRSTEWVQLAMGGVLSQSGLPGRAPMAPPGRLSDGAGAVQAAWAALLAYTNRLATGVGDHIDLSMYEATAQVLDPAIGTVGLARAAYSETGRDRPAPGPYPIFRCVDGYVRLVILSAPQWRALRNWIGEPPELQDPVLDSIAGRAAATAIIQPILATFFRDREKMELTSSGQARSVPIAPVLSLAEVVTAEHFELRGAVGVRSVAPGLTARVPTGFVEIDGQRAGYLHRAPLIGEHTDEVMSEWGSGRPFHPGIGQSSSSEPASPSMLRQPLAGVRVLDMGVIVLGAEMARILADQGADVIKIESTQHPDGARAAQGGSMNRAFAIGHRNSRSIGLNLRTPEGVALFRRLVSMSDILLTNFKPGTLDKLGLSPAELREVNHKLVVVSSSAMGASGPWSNWMGYGPLVRSAAGITRLWTYPGEPESFSDGGTIYPDHFAARVAIVAALACLIGRRRSSRGAHVESSQAEAILMHLSECVLAESIESGWGARVANAGVGQAPWGIYPCLGDDEWCAITVEDEVQWVELCRLLHLPEWTTDPRFSTAAGRLEHLELIDERIAAWTRGLPPRAATAVLQDAGIPAGFMQRGDEYHLDPQLMARGFVRQLHQPGLGDIPAEGSPFQALHIPDPPLRPAPLQGQHTREVCREILGLDDETIDRLLTSGVLEEARLPVIQ